MNKNKKEDAKEKIAASKKGNASADHHDEDEGEKDDKDDNDHSLKAHQITGWAYIVSLVKWYKNIVKSDAYPRYRVAYMPNVIPIVNHGWR